MTIHEIKRRTAQTEPHFFSRNNMKFFGQTLKDFHVYKQSDGKFLITAQGKGERTGKFTTKRLFNPKTNKLETVQ